MLESDGRWLSLSAFCAYGDSYGSEESATAVKYRKAEDSVVLVAVCLEEDEYVGDRSLECRDLGWLILIAGRVLVI